VGGYLDIYLFKDGFIMYLETGETVIIRLIEAAEADGMPPPTFAAVVL